MIDDRGILAAAAARLVPGTASLDEAGRVRFDALAARALNARGASMRRRFFLFLTAIRWLPLLRWGRPFDSLSPRRQDAFLRWLEVNPLEPFRRGFWGLKTIAAMAYYGQPELAERFSYKPERDGNAKLLAR